MSQEITTRISQLFAAGRFADADKLCRSASRANPRDSMLPTIRGAIRLERGDLKRAVDFLTEAITLDPRNATAHFNLGVAQKRLLQLERAMASFRTALGLAGPSASILNAIGLTELALGRSADAAATLEQAAKRDPRSPMAFLNLGEALKASGQLDNAVSAYGKALSLKPDFAEALNGLGAAHAEAGKLTEAEECYRRALLIEPRHAMARNNLGVLLKKQGRLDEALNEFEAANKADPHYAMAFFNKGGLLREMQRPAEALEAFKSALSRRSDLAEAHLGIGWIHFERGSLEEARAAFARAIESNEDYGEAHAALGEVYKRQRAWTKARECLQRAVEIDANFYALMGLGDVLVSQVMLPAAETCFRRALELEPESQAARIALGKVLFDQGKLDEAEARCRSLIEEYPDSNEAHLVLAKILARKRKLEEAAAHYYRAIELKPTSIRPHIGLFESLLSLGRDKEAQDVTSKLKTYASDAGVDALQRMKALSSITEITGDLSYCEQAFDMALESGHADDFSFYTLLKPGLAIPSGHANSLLERMRRLEESGKSYQRSVFHRARSVLLHELQSYGAAWQDLASANRMVLDELDIESRPKRDNRERALETVKEAGAIDFAGGDAECRSVFILGVSRSGKSSLERLLRCAHGWIALDEYPVLEETFRDLQMSGETIEAGLPPERRPDFALHFTNRCKQHTGQGTFSFTGPGQIQYAKLLSEALPGARFIFVKRDESDVLFRCLQKLYKKGNVYSYDPKQCLKHVRWYGEMISELSARLGERARTVNYEDLVANASAIAPALWQWLGMTAPQGVKFSLFNDIGCSEPYRDLIAAEFDEEALIS